MAEEIIDMKFSDSKSVRGKQSFNVLYRVKASANKSFLPVLE